VKNKRNEIRQDLQQVLKRFTREELLAQLFHFPWGKTDWFKDFEKIKRVEIECAGLSNQQLIKRILGRDVEEAYKFRHSRV